MDRPPAPLSRSGHLRVARSPLRPKGVTLQPGSGGRSSLYFNVTVSGEELHLHLRPNRRLVVPGASVEWQEDFRELFRQPLQRECVYTGGVTGMPGAAVAISNCDGLVRDKAFNKQHPPPSPFPLRPPHRARLTWFSPWLPCVRDSCGHSLQSGPSQGLRRFPERAPRAPLGTRFILCQL